eukprot:1771718-Prorocentrum_lima.AAC.1
MIAGMLNGLPTKCEGLSFSLLERGVAAAALFLSPNCRWQDTRRDPAWPSGRGQEHGHREAGAC